LDDYFEVWFYQTIGSFGGKYRFHLIANLKSESVTKTAEAGESVTPHLFSSGKQFPQFKVQLPQNICQLASDFFTKIAR
jgi:hypothetical protein